MNVEIIGVAGSGKSTLVNRILLEQNSKLVRPPIIRVSKYAISMIIAFFKGVIPLVLYSKNKYLINNFRMYIHMNVTLHLLNDECNYLFDQGVIYQLASFQYFGFKKSGDKFLINNYCMVIDKYIEKLDQIIFLKISIEKSVERVNKRSSYHMLKGFTESQQKDFFDFYNDFYQKVLDRAKKIQTSVLIIDTDNLNAKEVFSQVNDFYSKIKNNQ